MEKIISITDSGFDITEGRWTSNYDGYVIKTTDQEIKIGIRSEQSCCESFGCLITNDDISEFIGAALLHIAIVDEALHKEKIEELEYLDCGGAMFVNIETSNGLLQFVAYNAHNGYYGHDAVLLSKQLNHSETL